MRAIVLKGKDLPLEMCDVPMPVPQAGEALVRIKSAALNHRDVWISKGMYAGLKYPIVLGSDAAGVVEQVGSGVPTHWIGCAVVLTPGYGWGDKAAFQSKSYCVRGLPDDGTLAEYIVVPIEQVFPKPAHLSFDQAAALPLAGLTAYRALFSRAQVRPHERVLVSGIGGGVALFACQFALAMGCEVWVTSGSEDKIAQAQRMGVRGGVLYNLPDWEKGLLEQAGFFDVAIDSAGGEGFAKLVHAMDFGGRIVFYGGTKGTINGLSPQKLFWKQISLLGSTMGSDTEFEAMLDFVNTHKIEPVVDTVFALKHTPIAFERMATSGQFGKIVIQIG